MSALKEEHLSLQSLQCLLLQGVKSALKRHHCSGIQLHGCRLLQQQQERHVRACLCTFKLKSAKRAHMFD
jgi:hypothetical protein